MGIGLSILIFILLVFIFYWIPTTPSYLQPLEKTLYQFLKDIHQPVRFKLYHSKQFTYTKNKSKIYLYSSTFDFQTLFLVCLHEIAHIICPDHHHTKLFYSIEKDLIQKAIQLQYIQSDEIDQSYPCFE